MNFKNHLIFSIWFIFFFVKLFNILIYINLWHVFFFGLIFSLFPDIDHKKSFLRYNIFFWFWFIFISHRKITHSFFSLIILFLSLFYLNYINLNFNLNTIVGITIGYLSHIVADIFSFRGVYFFWPLNIRVKFPLYYFFYNKVINYFLCILFLLLFFFYK